MMDKLQTVDPNQKLIKQEVTLNRTLNQQLAHCSSFSQTMDILLSHFHDMCADESFIHSLELFAMEHQTLSSDPGIYLNDPNGTTLFKLTDEMIFYPPDTIREDGTIIKRQPVVHPGITSGLALLSQERAWLKSVEEKYGSEVVAHIKSPWNIIKLCSQILIENGMLPSETSNEDIAYINCEIGHENVAGVFQAVNPMFKRLSNFSMALTREIMTHRKNNFFFQDIKLRKDSHERWYEITYQVW